MKRFIFNILIWGLPFWGIMCIVDYCYSKRVEKSNYCSIEQWNDIINGNIDADIVIMGSSRAWVQINPMIIDSVLSTNTYNLGTDGSNFNRQMKKYIIYRKYNKKPKLVIQNIDFCSTLGYNVGYEKIQFCPFFWNKSIRDEFWSSEPFSFFEKYAPMYRFRNLFPSFLLSLGERSLNKGYRSVDESWNGEEFEKIDSIRFNVNSTTLNMFCEYLKKNKEDSIKVVLVYAPIYIGATEKVTNLNDMYTLYQNIANKYGATILDYNYMDMCKDTAYFYNAMHLNKRGSEIFTDSLANDIKRLALYH